MKDGEALIVVDFQRGFINQHTQHLCSPIEALQANFDHVVATRFYHRPGSTLCRLLGIEGYAKGSPETELALRPTHDAHVNEKASYSCLTPRFVALLRSWGVRTASAAGPEYAQSGLRSRRRRTPCFHRSLPRCRMPTKNIEQLRAPCL